MISRLTAELQYPLSTLHERRCRRPCKTRFRLAGSAFAGRVSNPLDHDERFQVTSILLSRAYPDASWAYGRRKLFDIAKLTKAPIAVEAVRRIDEIFAVERTINGRSSAERVAARQQQSKPLVLDLEHYLREQRMLLSAKSDTAKAINYILIRWVAFTRFLGDGKICMSNNAAERALRGIAIGRRNWTFCRLGRGRPSRCLHLHADRDRQAQRCRSAGLARRRPRPAARPSLEAPPRAAALELEDQPTCLSPRPGGLTHHQHAPCTAALTQQPRPPVLAGCVRLSRRGAYMESLCHSASLHSNEKTAPLKSGIKQYQHHANRDLRLNPTRLTG